MIYKFTYRWGDRVLVKVCTTLREAEVFFDILVSAHAEYIKVVTFKKERG